MHAEVQRALREAVLPLDLGELLEGRSAVSERITHRLREWLARTGLVLDEAALQEVLIADELKQAFVEVARATALAGLERARGARGISFASTTPLRA